MIYYKLNVNNYEYYTLNLSTMIQNSKVYTREENNLGSDSSMFLPDASNLCDTVVAEKTDLSRNNIPEIIYLILYSLHIGDSKYRIHSSKTETATNIIIHKMTKNIESNTILEGIDD